ncbi:hypothetical protein CL3_31360 [butyrate-producing bacterium SM4/1]|nr:hypothetical protein CLOM621_05880 [Clostridium sp. M62/1]CBK77029.1 hypothetical protein CLS_14070 [[Clostridium] cf. saccharolyticum K10]CBL36940.1 hypothetical protein CL3_31360 [butyrate-producing bacterium SM4/1]
MERRFTLKQHAARGPESPLAAFSINREGAADSRSAAQRGRDG